MSKVFFFSVEAIQSIVGINPESSIGPSPMAVMIFDEIEVGSVEELRKVR